MKTRFSLCCALISCAFAFNATGQIAFEVNGPPAAGVDTAAPTTLTKTFNGPGYISDLNVQVEFDANWGTDIDIRISHLGASALLFNATMDENVAFNVTFDDQALVAVPHSGFGGNITGRYRPDNPLSVFNNLPVAGKWTLTLQDTIVPGDGTNLLSWTVSGGLVDGDHRYGRRPAAPKTMRVTDMASIYSAMTSGLGMGRAVPYVSKNAGDKVLDHLNSRKFRARSGNLSGSTLNGVDLPDGQNNASAVGSDSSLLRYLAFVQDEHMSYKVALGLADGEERTLEVNMVDTLSAQAGTKLNSQSLGGGLPYAMMGVPLMPMAGGAATVHVVEAVPSGKAVIDDGKAVVEAEPLKRWELFVAGDFSLYDQDQVSDVMQGFESESYAGSVGIEYRLKNWLNLGLAWSYLQSDTDVSGNYGNIDLEGNMMSGYATAFWRQYWADLLYSYGSFDSDINRNTGLGSTARSNTDSDSHNIRLSFGRNFNIGNNIVTGPIAGVRYGTGSVDPYSESGGGLAALDYSGTDFESMVSRLGWQATHALPTGWGRLLSQVHLAWEHEYMPENGTVSASLQTSPFALVTGNSVRRIGGFTAEGDGAHPGTDWLAAGAGLRFEFDNGVAVLTDYEGVFFRSDASQHYASAKLSYEWGTFMPREKGSGKDVMAYESLTVEQPPEQHVATTSEVTEESDLLPQEEKKNSSGDFLGWLGRKDRNGTTATTETAAVKVSNPAPTLAPESEPEKKAGLFARFKKKKSETAADEEEDESIPTKPVPEPIPGSGSKKGSVVYKTWDDVPGLKKSGVAAPAKPAEKKDPSS